MIVVAYIKAIPFIINVMKRRTGTDVPEEIKSVSAVTQEKLSSPVKNQSGNTAPEIKRI